MNENDMIARLRTLIAQQPALAQSLRGTRDVRSIAAQLAQAGAMNGIPTSAAEIIRFAERMTSKDGRTPTLSDPQLDHVVGGAGMSEGERLYGTLQRLLFD